MHKNLQLFYVLVLVTAGAVGARWYMNRADSPNLKASEAVDFAIADTAKVTRIVIADKDGQIADLRRQSGNRYWSLNNRHLARKDAVDLILKTFKRVAVKGPVPQAERPTVMRMLAGRAKKVDVFLEGEGTPHKTWYIGTATPSHTGTYMLLETAAGMAEEPFVMHMEGFTGFLSTRFFTDEREWRYTGVFDFPGRTLKEASCMFHENPANSWTLQVGDSGKLSLLDGERNPVTFEDTLSAQELFLRYRKVHLETYNHHLTEAGLDSIRSQASPAFTLYAKGEDQVARDSIQLFWKASTTETYDEFGELNAWDGSRMYGRVNGDEIVLVQRFVFDPLIMPLADIVAGGH